MIAIAGATVTGSDLISPRSPSKSASRTRSDRPPADERSLGFFDNQFWVTLRNADAIPDEGE